jgi:tetratricopeptide (TPR) repeat protein
VKLDQIPKAITEYKQYLSRKPDDRKAQYVLARLYVLSRNIYAARRITDSILKTDPDDITAMTVRAQCHLLERQYTLAVQDLEQIVHLAPGWAPPYLAIAALQWRGHDPEEAETYLRRAVAASPGDLRPVVALGEFYASQRRLAEAEAVFLRAVGDNPKNPQARVAYALFLNSMGRFDEAQAQYKRVLADDPNHVPALMGSVETAIVRRQLPSATEFIGSLLKTESGRLAGLYYRGIVNLLEEKPDKAIEDLLKVSRENEKMAQVHYLLAIAYLLKNDVKQARSRLARALQIDPAFTAAQLVLAEILMATGSRDEAIAEAEEVLKKQANNLWAILLAGQGYLLQRAPEKAQPYFEKSVEIDRRSIFARMVLANIYRQTDNEAQAIQTYTEIIEINPNIAIPYYLLGTLYYDMRDYRKAIEQYRKAIEKDPAFPPALNNLAFTYAEHGGDLDEAQRLIEPLAEKFPEQPSIQDTFAWVLFKKGLYPRSLSVLEAIPPSKRDERTLIGYHYAHALYKNNKETQARAEFEKILPKIEDESRKNEIQQILSEIGAKT